MQLQIIPHHSGTHQARWYFGNLSWTPIFQKKKNSQVTSFYSWHSAIIEQFKLEEIRHVCFFGGRGWGDLEQLSVTYSGFFGDQYTGLGT